MSISSRGSRNLSKLNTPLDNEGLDRQPFDQLDGPGESRAFTEFAAGGREEPASPDGDVVGQLTPDLGGDLDGGETERAPTGPGSIAVPTSLLPATPNAGVAIIGYNTGQNNESPAQIATLDKLHFVLLGPVGSGTQIFITDRAWNGTAFTAAGGDGTLTWTAGADLAAGTVVTATLSGGNVTFTVNGVTTAPVSAGGFDIDHTSGDAIYLYQGAINAPTSFLYAGEFADGNTTFNGSLVNTGLTAGFNAVAFGFDSGAYNGPTTHAENFLFNGAGSTILHAIADSTNWVGDDSTGDNAREQEVQTGPWFVHADVEFWGTMANGGLANTLRDPTHLGGNDDYNHTRLYDGLLFPVGHPQAGQNVFASLRDMVFDTVDGKFFVVDSNISGVNRILQGNISDLLANPGSVPTLTTLWSYTQIASELDGRLDNIEVDLANNIVYFTAGSKLYKVNYDTANQAGTMMFDANAQGAFSATTGNPAGSTNNFFNDMVINFATGHIYISSTRVVSGASDQISKNFIYDLSGLTTGSGVNAFTMNGGTNTGTARLLPFAENDDVYNPTPGTTHTPATTAQQPYFWPNERGSLDGLAIDPVNNLLYFSTGEILFDHDLNSGTPVIYSGGVIASYALTGNPTGLATILHQQTAQFGGALPGLLGDLEVDLQNGHLYVLDYNGVNGNNEDNHWFRMNTNGTGIIQFTQTIGDPDGAATVGLTLNHAPTLTGSAAGGLAVTEASSAPNSGETARVTLFTGITIADVDTTTADEITGAVVRIGNGFTFEAASTAGGHTATVDFLRINGLTSGTIAGSGINFTYNSSTGAMVLTGAATVAEYKAAIELVQFSTSGDNVTNNGNAATRTIHVSVSDGLTMSDEVSATVTVTGINDAPVNTPGAAMNFTEDTTGNVGAEGIPPTPVRNAVTGISIADADADATTENFTVTLSVANGILNIRTDVVGGLAAGDVTGNGTSTLVLTGTQTEINTTLAAMSPAFTGPPPAAAAPNGLIYTPNANFNGADTLTMITNDGGNNGNDPGNSGTGTTEADTDTKTLNIAEVNDAPTVVDATQDSPTILEDVPFTNLNAPTVASLFGTSFSDALDDQDQGGANPTGSPGDTFAGIAVVANGSNANGSWQYWDGAAWQPIGAASLDAAKTFTAATLIRFNPTLNFNGAAPTLTVHLIESGGPAIVNAGTVDLNPAPPTTGAGSVYSAGTVVLSQTITPVNDAPTTTNVANDSVTYTEQQALAALLDAGSNATVADVDSPNFDTGTLTVAITGGLVAAEDRLVIRLTGTVSFNATGVFVNGTQIATYTGHNTSGPLVFTFDPDATPAAVAELIRAIAYNNVGGDNPTDGNRTITWTLVDGDGTANTGVDTVQFTSTVDVDPVNDAPQGTDATFAFNEDGSRILSLADFGYSDPAEGHGFAGVVITTLPTNGVLLLNGVPIALAGTFVTAAQIAGNQLVFQSDANENGTPYGTFTFQVRDDGGILDGGQDTDQSANTLTFNVNPVNDAPTSTNLNGDAATYAEGSAFVLLDVGSNATVADIDSADFDTGTLTVSISGGLVAAEDQLVLTNTGTVTFTANTVSVGGTQIATYTGGGAGGGNLVFTFDADATPAAVQTLIQAIGYTNSDLTSPTGGVRTIGWTLVDGDGVALGGADTLALSSTVEVISVNSAPQGTDATFAFNEDGSRILAAADFGFSDPAEGDNFAGVVITTLPTNGVLLLNGVPVTVAGTFVTAAQISGNQLVFQSDADENGTPYATFTFQVRDDGGIANGGQDTDQSANTLTFNVNAVNDAPVNSLGGTVNINEDAVDVPLTGMSIADVDANPATDLVYVTFQVDSGTLEIRTDVAGGITAGDIIAQAVNTITVQATLNQINATLAAANGLTYSPNANFNGNDTLTVYTNDGGATGADPGLSGDGTSEEDVDTRTISVAAVNDAPAGTDNTVTASEDDPYVFTAADFGFSDPVEGDDFAGVVLTTLPVEGDLRLNGVNITVAGTFISAADIAAGLLTFLADPDEFGDDYASFTFQVRDDGGILNGGVDTDQSANTITIDVDADNIAPTLDLDGDDSNTVGTGYSASFTEGGAAVLITDSDVAIADVDVGDMIEAATITISSPVAGDQLVLGAQGGFVVTGSGTGSIQITGTGTAAQYEAMLELITFSNSSDDPGTTRTINITVTDGDAASNVAVSTINIAEVNDEPTLAATAVNPTFTEGGASVDLFSGVTADTIEAGQTFVSLTLTVTNVTDGANEILVVDGMNVTLTNGNVVATGAGNVTVTLAGSTATVVVGPSTLSEAALQTLIDGLGYLNTSENPTDANRVVTITQLVDSGSNTSPSDAVLAPGISSTVNVNPINDTPIATVPGLQTINEDGSVTLSTGNGNAITVSDADATTLTVTLSVAHGTLTLASTAGLTFSGGSDGTADTTMTFNGTQAAINAAFSAGLTYNPNANFNGSDAISMTTTDNGQSGGPAESDVDTVPINITAINDAPVVIGDGTESAATINEDSPSGGQTIQALFAGQYSDAADNQVPNGGVSSPGQFSGIAVTANGSSAATGQWQYFSGGVWTDIGAVSDSMAKLLGDPFVTLIRFNPAPDYNGPAPTLTVHLIDNSLPFGIVNGQVVDLSGPGATGGTTAYSSGTVVLSQDVTAVNDGPLNTVPGAQTINEDASFTLSNGNGNAIQVADVDATTLTVTLTVQNGTLTLASTAGLSFSGGSDGTADLTMTFSGTAAAINAALGSGLTYNPTINYNGPDSIAVLTTDNGQTGTGGTLQDNDSVAITVNSVNDAPAGADNTLTGSEDDPLVFTLADFGFTDPVEGDDFLAVIIDSFPANGTLFLDPDGPGGAAPVDLSTLGPGVFVSASDIALGRLYFQPDTDEFGNGYAQFTFRVQDDGGMANGGVDRDPVANTIFINITPDNLPPAVDLNGAGAGIDAAVTYNEDSAGVSIGTGIVASDPDEGLGDMIESATITLTDALAGDALTLTAALPPGFLAVTTPGAGTITITITGTGTGATYSALLDSILYSTSDQNPVDLSRTVTVVVNDGTVNSAVATSTITIVPSDDAPVAQPDGFATDEATVLSDSVFPDNGSGPDSDVDGPALSVSAVNGSTTDVGNQITLPSGALLTLRADGTFDYDPNGAFDDLPGPASGASNLTDTDSFSYTLTGGNTVTVTILVSGLDSDGDVLLGTPGADTLDGGIGSDTMTGFGGDDIYLVDQSDDVVIEAVGEGNDTIRTSVDYVLGAAVSVETMTTRNVAGTDPIDLTGNGFDNRLEGNAGVNILTGNGGIDLLFGFGGDDLLDGGAGNDLIDGGTGVDTALFSGPGVGLADTLTGWVAISAQGNDFLQNVEITVDGSGQRNLLVGSTGFATIQAAFDNALAGDIVRLAAGSYTGSFTYDADDLTVIAQPGAVLDAAFSTTSGFGITILAAGGNDDIATGEGDDRIDGGAGTDTMAGGTGNDWYYVDGGDTVIEGAAEGTLDRVFASTSYTLTAGAYIEILTTTFHAGTAAIDLGGNELDNLIYGNAGDNDIDGHAGADAMIGFGGDDWYYVDNAGDYIVEGAAEGNGDRVFASASYTLSAGAHIEVMTTDFHAGTAAIDLTGNELGNLIYGNAGSNVLDGKQGNDSLVGFGGADTFAFTTALGAGNADLVFDFDADDVIALDDAVFTGLSLGALSANAFTTGTAATTADHRIVYNQATGQLFYDADGNGAGAQVLFATLQGNPVLTASDFSVI